MHQNVHTSGVNLLHVSARHGCHHQGILPVANVMPQNGALIHTAAVTHCVNYQQSNLH